MKKGIAIIVLIIVMATLGFCLYMAGVSSVEPEKVTEYIELPPEVIQLPPEIIGLPPVMIEVEKIVEKTVYVERIVTENITIIVPQIISLEELSWFGSVTLLRNWVVHWEYTPIEEWREIEPGVMSKIEGANDCDDHALAMVRDSSRDGYIMGFVLDLNRKHMTNVAIVGGNRLYFIEPQTGEISFYKNGTSWVLDKE